MSIPKLKDVVDLSHGLFDGTYWKKEKNSQEFIKEQLRLLKRICSAELSQEIDEVLDAILKHEKVKLYPRDRVVVLADSDPLRRGDKGTLVQVHNAPSLYGEVLVDTYEFEHSIRLAYLDPESAKPGPKDINILTKFEKKTVDALYARFRTGFIKDSLIEADTYGLLVPLLVTFLRGDCLDKESVISQCFSKSKSDKVFQAYIQASVYVIENGKTP